jgi:hypothetical protein
MPVAIAVCAQQGEQSWNAAKLPMIIGRLSEQSRKRHNAT